MTTTTVLAPASFTPARRIGNVVRLHLANPFTTLITPLVILAVIFAASWVVWFLVARATGNDAETVSDVSDGFAFSGATSWIFVYMLVVAVQAMNTSFPLALGFGSTRREFYLGSVLSFVLLAIFYTLVYTAMTALEIATNGWGTGGRMFEVGYFGLEGTPLALRAFHVLCAFLFFFFVGTAVAAVYVRWRQRGLLTFFVALAIVLVGGGAALTFGDGWGGFGTFFATLGFTGSWALALGIAAVCALLGWLVLRRATPRS